MNQKEDKRPSGVKRLWTLQEATYQFSWLQFGRSDPTGQDGKEMIDSETQLEKGSLHKRLNFLPPIRVNLGK